jgi:uncharacterized protein YggU (UPF0235/DUF167 family)
MKLSVKVITNARRPRVEAGSLQLWRIYVSASPEKGRANKQVRELLARHLGVKTRQIVISQGEKSQHKTILVTK